MAQIFSSSSSSVPTKPAFVHEGDWDELTDQHPACEFMRRYTNTWDDGDRNSMFGKMTTENFSYAKADGSVYPEGRASWDAIIDTYALFEKVYHLPYFLAVWEREDGSGWELSGNAYLFGNLPGAQPGETRPHTAKGQNWDVMIPAGFHFGYTKEGDNVRLDRMAITSDSGPVVVKCLQRGILKPADLGL